jgi:hypothetical protein
MEYFGRNPFRCNILARTTLAKGNNILAAQTLWGASCSQGVTGAMRTKASLRGFLGISTKSWVFWWVCVAWTTLGIWQLIYQFLIPADFKLRHQWGNMISRVHWYWWLIAALTTLCLILFEIAYSNYRKYGFVRTLGKRSTLLLGQTLAQYGGTKKICLLLPKQYETEEDRRERRKFAKQLAAVFRSANWEVHQLESDIELYPHEGLVMVDYAANNGQHAADYEFLSKAFSEAAIPSNRDGTTSMHMYTNGLSTSDFIIYIGAAS